MMMLNPVTQIKQQKALGVTMRGIEFVAQHFGFSFGFGNVAKSANQLVNVTIRQHLQQILVNHIIAIEHRNHVNGEQFFSHNLNLLSQFNRTVNISLLRRFITTRKQNHQFTAAQREINAITRANINSHFRYTTANRFNVTKIAIFSAFNASKNRGFGFDVAQIGVPLSERFCFFNQIIHAGIVSKTTLTHYNTPQHTVIDHNRLLCEDKIEIFFVSNNINTDKLLPMEVMEGGAFLVDLQSPGTLTNVKSMAKIIAPRNIEVGFSGSFFRQGDNTPIIKSVFLCLPFLDALKFEVIKSIMTALFGQPLRLVAPCRDTANPLNAVTRFLAVLRDGFTHFRQGITA